jgi:predicted porin
VRRDIRFVLAGIVTMHRYDFAPGPYDSTRLSIHRHQELDCSMNIRLLFCSTFALAGSAHAESVTIYGIVDSSVGLAKAGKGAASVKRVDSGVGPASRLGIAGKEDLGDGYKARFQLEQGIALDTGTLQPGGLGFGRTSWVGVGNDKLFISLGRQYSPMDDAYFNSSVSGFYYWGSAPSNGFASNASPKATPATAGFQATDRISNSVKGAFTAGSFGGGVIASVGDEASIGTGHLVGGGVYYASPPFRVDIAYNKYRQYAADIPANAEPALAYDLLVGGNYNFGFLKLNAAYYRAKPATANTTLTAASTLQTSAAWLGVRVPIGAGFVVAQVMGTRYDRIAGVAQGKGTTVQLAYEYFLSKRTNVYASYGQVSNNDTSQQPLLAGSAAVVASGPGSRLQALSFGVTHRF